MSRGPMRRRLPSVLFVASFVGTFAVPGGLPAQSVAWSAGALVLLDTDFTGGTEVGPGLWADLSLRPGRRVGYVLSASAARTDFPVGPDDLHRNFGTLALGLALRSERNGVGLGLLFGLGATAWDDVSETDPGFRSSANLEGMLLPGVELTVPVTPRWRLVLSARDEVTGWWNALLDPEEGAVSHRVALAVGLGSGYR